MYTSLNYLFCFNILKRVFYMPTFEFDPLYGNENATKLFILNLVILIAQRSHVAFPPQYIDLPVHFEENEDHKAIILEVPDAMSECDCNYVALRRSKDGKLLFISSELYSFRQIFKLCVYTEKAHYSLSTKITSYRDFVDAALALKDDYD